MVRCPNCGSTAQVKKVFSNHSTAIGAQCNHYKCGCGCTFSTRQYPDGRTHGEWHITENPNKAGDGEK